MDVIVICKFVHVIKEDDAGRSFFGFLKSFGDIADKTIAAFISAYSVGAKAAFFNEALGYQGLAETGFAIE